MDDFSLNALGILCGTDKSQLGFDYLRHYDRSLAQFRAAPMNLMEIGVSDGASIRMWKRYFPKATIVGVDIQERCRAFEEDRVKIEIGSQSDGPFIDSVMTKYRPTVMIDDGSHIASDIIFTFERAFPALLAGGCYVIEDLFMHKEADAAWQRGSAPMGAQDYILTYARRLMDSQPHPLHEGAAKFALFHSIDRIEAIGGAAFIWKKQYEAANIDYDWLELLVQRRANTGGRGTGAVWGGFAGYLLRTNGPLTTAERAARAALAAEPGNWSFQSTLARILAKGGDFRGAKRWFDSAAALAPEPWRTDLKNSSDGLKHIDSPLDQLAVTAAASRMENIGQNCEFGLIMDKSGVEAFSLLKFSGTPKQGLIKGLQNRFAGLGDEFIGTKVPPNGPPDKQLWWLTCKRYGILFHTSELVQDVTIEQASDRLRRRIRWLIAKFLEDVKLGEKLFVFSDSTMSDPNDARDILVALRDIGPRAWLWSVAENKARAGETLLLGDGLIGSCMTHLTRIENAYTFELHAWQEAILVAHGIWDTEAR
jgi:hypothetical protein